MRFVRVTFNRARAEIVGVAQQDTPFHGAGGEMGVSGDDCETFDFGVVQDAGEPGEPTRAWLEAMRAAPTAEVLARRVDIGARVLDCPCTIDGIKTRLRERGPNAIPVGVRAWLANVLPPDQVAAMGLGRGLPISIQKAMEALRVKRDPAGGSRMFVLERKAQRQADAIASARHNKRLQQAAKAKG
jgi:hypothetical protein